jgi:hypothetical protein
MGPIGDNTRLGLRPRKKDYIPYEIFIATKLWTEQDSPWKDYILPPNATGKAPITEGSFTDSLGPMMDYASKANLTMRELITLLKNFWSAVFKLCPESKAKSDNYVLMKTSGVYSLHIFLPILLMRRPNLKSVALANQFEQVLQTIDDCFTDGFWESTNGEAASFGTGRKSSQDLAEYIVSEIP